MDKYKIKKICFNFLYPHIAVIIFLFPIAVAFLVLSLIYFEAESILAILSYLLSFYVLLVICFRMPTIFQFFKTFKRENKYAKKYFNDVQLRINISLYGTLIWNVAFAIFQLVLGFYHKSFWFYAMFAYYVILCVMRFFLFNHTRKYKANEETRVEIKKSIFCGWLLVFMNIALAVIILFMVVFNKTFYHHMITTIALAAYTFFTFTFAIVNLVRYRKYKSPVYSSAKTISLIAGAVSMLTLERIMLTTFGTSESQLFSQIMLSLTGIAVIAFAITMATIMIVKGNKSLKFLNQEKKNSII